MTRLISRSFLKNVAVFAAVRIGDVLRQKRCNLSHLIVLSSPPSRCYHHCATAVVILCPPSPPSHHCSAAVLSSHRRRYLPTIITSSLPSRHRRRRLRALPAIVSAPSSSSRHCPLFRPQLSPPSVAAETDRAARKKDQIVVGAATRVPPLVDSPVSHSLPTPITPQLVVLSVASATRERQTINNQGILPKSSDPLNPFLGHIPSPLLPLCYVYCYIVPFAVRALYWCR
ncbi:hypothetical protein BDZ89DRAFT_1131915 [Hymenopellis radicata]|nr:hypothetical protein BDZ89DRAFT_1131915 [Hymenopellis radicata]